MIYKLIYSFRKINCFILAIFFTLLVFGQALAQVSSPKTIKQIAVKLEVVKKNYCIGETTFYKLSSSNSKNLTSGTKKIGELHLQMKLTIVNLDSRSIIFDRNIFRIVGRTVTVSNERNKKEKLISKDSYYVNSTFNKIDTSFPDEQHFIILKTNETYTVDIPDMVQFDVKNSVYLMKGVSLKYEMLTWGGQIGLGEKTREKWSQFGYLWIDTISTDSILLKIDQSNNIPACGNEN
jgi:hypothetical protein